ncbi:MAG: DMT family transporter [Devosiaceae bacterium]|nr:DMT family transporter [Devosiaceae bacterium MH13]
MTGTAWLLLLLLAFLWGGSFVFAKIAVAEIPPFTLVFFRVALAAVTLHLVRLALRIPMDWSLGAFANYAVMGLLNNVIAFSLMFTGQTQISASLASILNASTPFFTLLVAGLLLTDEKLTGRRIAGLIVGFAGVILVIGPRYLLGMGDNLIFELMLIGTAISYAFAGVWGRRFAGENPLCTAAGQLTGSTLLMIPIMFVFDDPLSMGMPSTEVIASVIALAVVSTGFAYILFFRILKIVGATNVMLVTMLVPVFTALIAVPLLGESIDALKVAGMAVIAIGMAILDGRPVKAVRRVLMSK